MSQHLSSLLIVGLLVSVGGLSPVSVANAQASEPSARLREGQLAGPTFFVLAAYIAPPEEMRKWKLRGVNTILGVGQGVDENRHHAEAVRLGLRQIRRPRIRHIADDLAEPSVIAFETVDEPTNIVDGHPRETPDDVSAEIAPWRAAAASAGVVQPAFTNHIGAHIWQPPSRVGLGLADYHQRSDWYGSDTYQIAAQEGNLLTQDGFTSTYQGHVLDLQRQMAPGAPLLSFVQTSAYDIGKPIPTPGELKVQIWSSVVHGASMIAVFPVRLAPTFAWDATPQDLVATIKTEFAAVTGIEDILIDRDRGGARPARVYPAAPQGQDPAPGQLPWPFEARLIERGGADYTLVLNLSDAPAMLSYREWGVENRAFGPSEVRGGWGQDW